MELICRDHLKSIFKFTYHKVYSLWYVFLWVFNKSLGLCDPFHHCDTRQLCYPRKLHCDALSSPSLFPPVASIHLFPPSCDFMFSKISWSWSHAIPCASLVSGSLHLAWCIWGSSILQLLPIVNSKAIAFRGSYADNLIVGANFHVIIS